MDETITIGKNVIEENVNKEADRLLESINKVIEITKGIDMYKSLDSKAAELNLGLIPISCQFYGKTSGLDGDWYSIYCTLGCEGENMKFSTLLRVFAKYSEDKNEIEFETSFEPMSDKSWTTGEKFLNLCVDLLETMKIIFKCAVRLGLGKENVSVKEN